MAKEQFNFRLEGWILERIREQAKVQGISVTEWMESACLTELGVAEDTKGMIEGWREADRIKKLEHDVKGLKDNLETIASRLDTRVDGVWDSIDYISVLLETLKETADENKRHMIETAEWNAENELVLRKLHRRFKELEAKAHENALAEAMREIQEEMEEKY